MCTGRSWGDALLSVRSTHPQHLLFQHTASEDYHSTIGNAIVMQYKTLLIFIITQHHQYHHQITLISIFHTNHTSILCISNKPSLTPSSSHHFDFKTFKSFLYQPHHDTAISSCVSQLSRDISLNFLGTADSPHNLNMIIVLIVKPN